MFRRLETQWRIGMNGRTGLDYCAAYPLMDRETSEPAEWLQLLDDLREIEIAALQQIQANAQ